MSLSYDTRYRRVVRACFSTSVATSVTGNLSPLLFLTFHHLYGLTFGELGLLVLINFLTQLLPDLVFSVWARRLNPVLSVKLTPWVIGGGLVLFGLLPVLFPRAAFLCLIIGTVVFSLGSGLAEVLTSPTVSAVPTESGSRLLSRLHAAYAWGVVGVVPPATVYLLLAPAELWFLLPILFALVPLTAGVLFLGADMPPVSLGAETRTAATKGAGRTVLLCVLCIFFGGASECTMAQWASGYLEAAIGVDKLWGDLFGVALFGAALGLGRTLFGTVGRRIEPWLLFGALGAAACYLVTVLSPWPVLGLVACALTGFAVSMLWPGSLIAATDRLPRAGVGLFALMAAGGDMGAALVPQLLGSLTDAVVESPASAQLAARLSMSVTELGMKLGMLVATVCPLLCALTVVLLRRIPRAAELSSASADAPAQAPAELEQDA